MFVTVPVPVKMGGGILKKHANIPIFIPHLGCPNNCVFCNQRSISGHITIDESNVKKEIDEALSSIERKGEITEVEKAED